MLLTSKNFYFSPDWFFCSWINFFRLNWGLVGAIFKLHDDACIITEIKSETYGIWVWNCGLRFQNGPFHYLKHMRTEWLDATPHGNWAPKLELNSREPSLYPSSSGSLDVTKMYSSCVDFCKSNGRDAIQESTNGRLNLPVDNTKVLRAADQYDLVSIGKFTPCWLGHIVVV